jgi:hypothetical protein
VSDARAGSELARVALAPSYLRSFKVRDVIAHRQVCIVKVDLLVGPNLLTGCVLRLAVSVSAGRRMGVVSAWNACRAIISHGALYGAQPAASRV